MNFEYFLCAKQLLSSDRKSLAYVINVLSVLGITIGVAVLVVFISVTSGFETEFRNRILGIDPHILIVKSGNSIANYNEVVNDLRKVDDVVSVEAVLYSQAFLRSGSNIAGAVVKSFDFIRLDELFGTYFDDQIEDLNNLSDGSKCASKVILGSVLAERLDVSKGDFVYLVSKVDDQNTLSFVPLEIMALIKTGIYQYDEVLVLANLTSIQSVFNMSGLVNAFEIKLNDARKPHTVARIVRNKLGVSYLVRDWTQINRELFLSLKIQKIIIGIMLSLIIIVASLNIASGLFMMILEKVRDIAILKTMGLESFRIRRIFIFRGMIMSFLGGVLGVLISCAVLWCVDLYKIIDLPGELYSLDRLPICINFWSILIIFFSTMLVCFLFVFYPANRASQLNPNFILSSE